jgi:hypothetical protein
MIPAAPEDADVMVGTPAYGGMMHIDFVNSLLGFHAAGLRYSLLAIGNESLITRARNTLVAEFCVRTHFTHLLFLDADVGLSANDLSRMLAAGVDAIGAPVALKGRNPDGSRIFNVGRQIGERGTLIEVDQIGTAALMLSRRAIAALVAEALDHGRVYQRAAAARGTGMTASVHYDIFRAGVVADEYLSEDFWVCRTLRGLGFPIYSDPAIVTRHSGTMEA